MKTGQGKKCCLPFVEGSVFNLSRERVLKNELQLPCKGTGRSYCNCYQGLAGIFRAPCHTASFKNKELG